MIEIIALALIMFVGLRMTEAGLRSLLDAPNLPPTSPLHWWLSQASPETACAAGLVFVKLAALFWSVLGIFVFLLAAWGLWKSF